jgi:DNA-binding MarR family transcriptional regulator
MYSSLSKVWYQTNILFLLHLTYQPMEKIKELVENMQTLTNNVRQNFHKRITDSNVDITYEMMKVLILLSENKYMNQQQIADLTFKNKASLTSLINNMEKRNLVVRNGDKADRRNKVITPTPKGKDIYNKVNPIFDEIFNLLNKEIPSEEFSIVNNVVLKMNKTVE